MIVLGIETSCDETAAAVVAASPAGGWRRRSVRFDVRSSVVASQVDQHARYGGVVPEIASRAHVELLMPIVAQAVVEAGVEDGELDAVAATVGPGLVGALLVGVSTAKALALAWDVPFVARQPHGGPPVRRAARGAGPRGRRWWCCSCPAATPCSC